MDIKSLVGNVLDQQPLDFQNNFQDVILNRIQTLVNDRKIELAKTLYKDVPEEEIENNTEEEEEVDA